ncbi:GntR family transcriptional regulator, partial [Nocardia cyriacigeorgica]|nr:GntR family transcriptional regulator [Nocardia cyriacigeorgica]
RLADSYGVSRTPVREALARLLADGLVERRTDGLYPFRPRLVRSMMVRSISATTDGWMPSVGSSRMSSFGSVISALAM